MPEEQFTRTIIVKGDPDTAYEVWSRFENFPKFMKYIKAVHKTDDKTSHWEMVGPLGKTVEWEAEMTRADPGQRIGWSTKDAGGDLTTSGQVTFAGLPNRQTEVTVVLHYKTKAGIVGNVVAKLLGNPEEKLEEDLRNFKAYIEGSGAAGV